MGHTEIKALFFEHPGKEFYLRQIARLAKTPKTTASRVLKSLLGEGLIKRINKEPNDVYLADTQNPMYRFYKQFWIIEKIRRSGVIEHIVEATHPNAVVLFGSCAKGEYNKESDIDLYVEGQDTPLDLERFRLGRKVHIVFYTGIRNVSRELRQGILNGIVLYGFVRI
jgi:predicted nucleotidyltransferase